jgi:hypothetical protein
VFTGRDLAARLTTIIEQDLVAVKRLNGSETWIGPPAQALDADLRALGHRLLLVIDDLLSHDRWSNP